MGALLTVFFFLLCGHALVDFALQSEQMQQSKRRSENPRDWWIVLSAHTLLHGGAVAIVLGSPLLGLFETVAHFCIDAGRGARWYGFRTDQALHVFCKVLWLTLFLLGVR